MNFFDKVTFLIDIVLPIDGPPLSLLGAPVCNAWNGYYDPELTGLGETILFLGTSLDF